MNKKLKNLFKLGSKISIFVPSTVDVDKSIDNSQYVNDCLTSFSGWFGGATTTKAIGAWQSPESGLVKEKIDLVYSYCTSDQLESHVEAVVELAEKLKAELKQEAIAVEINGELYFV